MNTRFLVGYKLFFGLLGLTALVTEIAVLVERGVFDPVNFFSFFTVESNILATIAFISGALLVATKMKNAAFDFFRGAATFYMIITGIVFALMLSGLEGVQLTAVPWDNTVLHYLIPIAIVVDWFLDPPKKNISFRRALVWLIFPLTYLGYSLVRGAIVGWYPYPFLNPANGGYDTIAITCAAILVGGVALVWALTWVSAKQRKRRT